jgi:GAF domain-containing protein
LEQQTATSEILRVISSSRTDLQPVFGSIAASALRLCDGRFSTVTRFDGELIHIAAFCNLAPEGVEAFHKAYPCPPSRGGNTQRAILTRSVVHVPDVLQDPEYVYREAAARAGFRSALSVPMLRDGQPIGAISVFRAPAKPFPDSQIELLKTFADQAVIAIENVRLFNETKEALEQQTATSEVLRVISASPTDIQPVFDTIGQAALTLCSASSATVATFDGHLIHARAVTTLDPKGTAAVRALFPRPPSRDITASRAILTRDVVMIPDVVDDPDYAHKSAAVAGGFRSSLAVPLIRYGSPIGAITVGRPQPGAFPDTQIALLQTFADQAVIAIENARLFNQTKEALEQQTATSEVLRVISASPTDIQPVFDTIATAALKLCRASSALVATFDGKLVHLGALAKLRPEGADGIRNAFPRPPSRETGATRAILTGSTVEIPDVLDDPDYATSVQALAGDFRSILAIPLMQKGSPIGAISVGGPEPGPFPDTQKALLQTFADQAVIAIENARLFNQTKEALEQQTATSEILRVISQSLTDVQPAFDTIAERAVKLCDAEVGVVSRLDGESIELAAIYGMTAEGLDAVGRVFPMRLSANTVTARTIRSRAVVHVADVMDDPTYEGKETARAGHFRGCLGVPMLGEGRVIGVVFVSRAEPGLFSERQVQLLQTFAAQAVIAVRNVQLFNDLDARTQQLTRSVAELEALGDVGRAVSSTLDLETVLATIVTRATQLSGMDGGAIYEYDEGREEFFLRTADSLPDALVDALRTAPMRKGEGALGRLAVTREAVEIPDIADEAAYQSHVRELLIRLGWRSLLAVPLLREDHLLGGLIVQKNHAGAFAPGVIALLKTFASQSALAIQNARLFREVQQKSRELEAASRHKSEFLANMSHELRTPLNAIIGFSEVLHERMFGEINDKQAEYLADILESGRHLLSLINDILDLSKIEAGRMEVESTEFDLPTAIENTLILVRERAQRHGIVLARKVDERLGMIRADERKVKQVLLNLLSNALKFTPEGGRIDVQADMRDGAAEISVTDTGVGIAPEDQEAVFEEFRQVGTTAKKVEGTGLGLAISRKFIELHGGTIWVQSQVGQGSRFAFTLPLTID